MLVHVACPSVLVPSLPVWRNCCRLRSREVDKGCALCSCLSPCTSPSISVLTTKNLRAGQLAGHRAEAGHRKEAASLPCCEGLWVRDAFIQLAAAGVCTQGTCSWYAQSFPDSGMPQKRNRGILFMYSDRMSFGSNGIYVGGKDTFISELTGNWNVKGAVFAQVSRASPKNLKANNLFETCHTAYSGLVWYVMACLQGNSI